MIKEEKLELIERGSFMKYLTTKLQAERGETIGFNTQISLYDLMSEICSFPTVNNQEANWVKDDEGWYCSWCTNRCFYDASGARVRTRHCPCCGRRMRG